jgi:hypothetical protein
LIQWIFYSVSSAVPRYWLPSLGVMAALLGIALTEGEFPGFIKTTSVWAAMVASLVSLYWGGMYLFMMDGWKVVLGDVEPAIYLNRPHSTYPSPYFGASDYINRMTAADSRVMVLGDARAFFLERPFVSATVYDQHPILRMANASPDGDALYEKVKQAGLTHILLNVAEGVRVEHYWTERLSEAGQKAFDDFWGKHAVLLLEDRGTTQADFHWANVYSIVPSRPGEGGAPPPNLFGAIMEKKLK